MNLDSRKIGLAAAATMMVLMFAMPTMAASAPQPAKKTPYTGPLAIEIGCQLGPCGTTNAYVEPYVSVNQPSWIAFPDPNGAIYTGMWPTGISTEFFPVSYTAYTIKDPYPGDFGVTPMKTIQVNMIGLVEVFAPDGTFLNSFSARVTLDCQNLNGQLVFLNTHPDVWGTTVSGTLTDVFSAVVSCAT